ncbi:hypothetical protein K9M74_02475 [Candidatus Woesearchaeota archaeon]|nr:hypothetical protein [Candidatus Woesearchaeota archaeon]
MIKPMNKKGVGWMPDDVASAFFALLLIIIGFVIFNQVNTLVAQSTVQEAYDAHTLYEQQRLLETYMQTPITLDGKTTDAQSLIAEYILLSNWLVHHKDSDLTKRRILIQNDFIQNSFEPTLNKYQVLSEELAVDSPHYAKDIYYVIRLVDTTTQQDVYRISHPSDKAIEKPLQAQVIIPGKQVGNFAPNEFIIIVELHQPKTNMRNAVLKVWSQAVKPGVQGVVGT